MKLKKVGSNANACASSTKQALVSSRPLRPQGPQPAARAPKKKSEQFPRVLCVPIFLSLNQALALALARARAARARALSLYASWACTGYR
jgi:hypothetical protein